MRWLTTGIIIWLMLCLGIFLAFFFFNDTATTEIYTLSLHDALPICEVISLLLVLAQAAGAVQGDPSIVAPGRSEEHTSELQSQSNLVCRLLLEKKKKQVITAICASYSTPAQYPGHPPS